MADPTPDTGVATEADGFGITTRDWVLGALTFPLLMFVIMFAITGAETLLARPVVRLKLYLVLLVTEVALIGGIVWWLVR